MSAPDFEKNELIPAIAQSEEDGQILMLAYMNKEAYLETLRTRRVCYFSRSRQSLWRKGESSGHVQHLKHIYYDCDGDTILVKVKQEGAACHVGYRSCFFTEVDLSSGESKVVEKPIFDPKEVYGSA